MSKAMRGRRTILGAMTGNDVGYTWEQSLELQLSKYPCYLQ